MRGGRILGLVAVSLLGSCSAAGSRVDPSEPVTIEDLQPLPPEVTRGNARLIVRKGLQAHRRWNALPDEQVGYLFRDVGFVQLRHETPLDRAQERISRTFVDYASISSVIGETYFDLQFVKERFRITLKGSFHRWEGPLRPFRALPEVGSEPWTVEQESLSLSLDDAVVTKRLMDALTLLSGR